MILDKEFYSDDALKVAKKILGKYLVREIDGEKLIGKIVETEAYLCKGDLAAHSNNYKKTERTKPLFEEGGVSYVYLIYGMYNCFNISSNKIGEPDCVLIRAIEPIEGLDYMAYLRYNKKYSELNNKEIINLTNGPSKLCKALSIDRSMNFNRVFIKGSLYIIDNDEDFEIMSSKRIGIDYAKEAKDYNYRFFIKDNKFVSKIKKVKGKYM